MQADPRQRGLTLWLVFWLALTLLAISRRDDLPPPAAILPESLPAPSQSATSRQPFRVRHGGEVYHLTPRADYTLSGLIVSRNDIDALSDIYHDDKSFDTLDICVIWGVNLRDHDYRKVEFRSGPWTCYVRWPAGHVFDSVALSNTHLVTASAALRDRLASLRIGDQVRLQGVLVDYVSESGTFDRRTSLVRDDEGNGACEVLFVESLQVMQEAPAGWRWLSRLGLAMITLVLILKAARVWMWSRRWLQR